MFNHYLFCHVCFEVDRKAKLVHVMLLNQVVKKALSVLKDLHYSVLPIRWKPINHNVTHHSIMQKVKLQSDLYSWKASHISQSICMLHIEWQLILCIVHTICCVFYIRLTTDIFFIILIFRPKSNLTSFQKLCIQLCVFYFYSSMGPISRMVYNSNHT